VYAVKWKENGEVEKQKARMVAKGFTQVIGEDYEETYASVARLESVQLLCAIVASVRAHSVRHQSHFNVIEKAS